MHKVDAHLLKIFLEVGLPHEGERAQNMGPLSSSGKGGSQLEIILAKRLQDLWLMAN